MRKYNFLIAEDYTVARIGIIRLLEQQELLKAAWEVNDGREAVAQCLQNPIDIVLIAYGPPPMNGYAAVKQILRKKKNVKIIVITQYDEIPVIQNFFKIGAKGFLTRSADESEIIDAIRTVTNGDYYYHTQHDKQIDSWLKKGLNKNVPSIHFSDREIQVITHMAKGLTSTQIAHELSLKARTIETYRYDLVKKTRVHNASELIGYAFRNGLL